MAGFLMHDLGMGPAVREFQCSVDRCPVGQAKLPSERLLIDVICELCGNGSGGSYTPPEQPEMPIDWDETNKITISGSVPK